VVERPREVGANEEANFCRLLIKIIELAVPAPVLMREPGRDWQDPVSPPTSRRALGVGRTSRMAPAGGAFGVG
jgi:hypothetical protein